MRILLINYEYPPVGGGASNATWEISRAMVKLGHEPVVLTARYKHRQPDTANPGIKVIEVPAIRRRKDRCSIFEMTTFVLSATLRIRSILRREKIEGMIAFFSIPCGPIAWWGWRGTNVPYIVSLRGGDVPGMEPRVEWMHRILKPLRVCTFTHAAYLAANSESLKNAAEQADAFSVGVIPNGIDEQFWVPAERRPLAPPIRLLFVGRLDPQKNLLWLLTEFSRAAASLPKSDVSLDIVGDGPERQAGFDLAQSLRIQKQLVWHGWKPRNDVRTIYQQSHVLLQPSKYEGMSNSLSEAAACGLPSALGEQPVKELLWKIAAVAAEPDVGTRLPALLQGAPATRTAGQPWTATAKQFVNVLSRRGSGGPTIEWTAP